MGTLMRAVAIVIAAVVVAGLAVGYSVANRGLGTRSDPHPIEATAAQAMRSTSPHPRPRGDCRIRWRPHPTCSKRG